MKKNKLRNSYPELKNTKKKEKKQEKKWTLQQKKGFCNCDEIKANLSLKAREGK